MPSPRPRQLRYATLAGLLCLLAVGCAPAAEPAVFATPIDRGHPLLLREGDAASGYGLVIADRDDVRLCRGPAGNVEGGPFTFPTQPCPTGVPLRGLDRAALTPSGSVRAGNVAVSGTWRDGGLDVTTQRPSGQPRPFPLVPFDNEQVPCPEPAGGWPMSGELPQEDYPAALTELAKEHPGDVLAVAVLAPGEGRTALGVVAADEPAAARAREALLPTYGSATCVIASPVTPAQFRAAASGARFVYEVREPEFATGLRRVVRWFTVVLDEDAQRALDALPDGLILVSAVLQPA